MAALCRLPRSCTPTIFHRTLSSYRDAGRSWLGAAGGEADRVRATTILSVRKGGMVAVIGDGQVSRGSEVVKNNGGRKVHHIRVSEMMRFVGEFPQR